MNKKYYKKGLAVVGWTLLAIFTVTIALLMANWTKTQTEKLTEQTVSYVENKLDCQSIKMTNTSLNCATYEVGLKNIGLLNIVSVSIQKDEASTEVRKLFLQAQGPAKVLNIQSSFKRLRIIPIIEDKKELIGCKEKSVVVSCP